MRRSISRVSSLAFALAVAAVGAGTRSLAVPACPEPFTVTQPNGKNIRLVLRGDERLHWHEDERGFTALKARADGPWVYAMPDATGASVPSRHVVGEADPSTLGVPKRLRPRAGAARAAAAAAASADVEAAADGETPPSRLPRTGSMKNLVLLVAFSDKAFTYSRAQYEALFNTVGYTTDGAQGSVKDYYNEVSYSRLSVDSVVVEPVTLSHGYAYYGGNDAAGWDLRPREMVQEALAALEARGFDFSALDADSDGWVDGLTVIHAGGGEEYGGNDANYIWSHMWAMISTVTYDGKSLRNYHTEPERRGWDSSSGTWGITRIGVICHENGHFLGLPDLYDYGYDSKGVGNFCLMAGGSWNGNYGTQPAQMSAWCKKYLGWVTPTAITASGTYSVPRVENNQVVFRLGGGFPSTQYFLVENRQGYGFDASLPGSTRGLLVWHVDETAGSNDDQTHYKVDLEEASGTQHLETNANSGDDADYFRSGTMTTFNYGTTPNSRSYSAVPLGQDITAVSASSATMTFTVSQQSLQFRAAEYSVSESGGSARIYVSRGGLSLGPVSVSYATANGTATAGADYTAKSGTLSWASGDAADKYFDVAIKSDSLAEGNESVVATLSAPVGAALGDPRTTVLTLIDDDTPVIWVRPSAMAFAGTLLGDIAGQSLVVSNAGAGVLQYTVRSDVFWLSVSAGSGSLSAGQAAAHVARVDARGLSPLRTYAGHLTVDAAGVGTQVVPVTLSLAALPARPVVAWGANGAGQCDVPAELGRALAASAGEGFSLALRRDGRVAAWGDGAYGRCDVPAGLSNVVAIAAGGYHSLALRADGSVAAWLFNEDGQCNVPAGLSDAVAVAAGLRHSLALRADGIVAAWGANGSGQCNVPAGLTNAVDVAAGSAHSLALRADGTVAAWGANGSGQCNVPAGLTGVVDVAAGGDWSLALRSDGTVAAWGANGGGQCSVPAGLGDVMAVSAGSEHALALKADGTVAAWGANGSGQCSVPTGMSNEVAVAAGSAHSLALGYPQLELSVASAQGSPAPAVGAHDYGYSNLVTCTVASPAVDGAGVRYRCTGWTGSGSAPARGSTNAVTFAITADSSLTWNWTPEAYPLVVEGSPARHGAPSPHGYGAHMVDPGAVLTESVASPADETNGTRYVCAGWTGAGSVPASGASNAFSFTAGAASAVTWQWATEHWLDTAVAGSGTVSVADQWIGAGSNVTIEATPAENWVFTGWSGGATGTANPVTVTVDGPKSVTASFELRLEPHLVVDNTDGLPWFSTEGVWAAATTAPGYWGTDYLHDGNTGKGTKTGTFRPTVATAGQYDVFIWYTAQANRANNVPVDIVHGGGTNTVVVNQRLNGSRWLKLGTFPFAAGSKGYVRIRTTGATTGYVIADAVKLEPVAALATPALSVSPAALAPACVQGQDAAGQSLEVWNSGGGTLSYTVSESTAWLSVSPVSGTSTGERDTLQVAYSTAGLATGTYSGSITITAAGAGGSPQTVAVTLSVMPAVSGEHLVVDNADGLPWFGVEGTWTAATTAPGYWGSNYLHDGNTGKGTKTATFRPTVAAAGQYAVYMWYTASANRASNVPVDIMHGGGTNTVVVNQRLNGSRWLKLGTFPFAAGSAGYVRIRTTGTTTGYVIADAVKLEPAAAPATPVLSVSPAALAPACQQGQDAAGQSLEVWNSGGGALSYTLSESTAWLSVSPVSGTSTGEHDTLQVAYSTAGLATGTYSGSITITAAGAGGSPQTVAVTLAVTPAVSGEHLVVDNADGLPWFGTEGTWTAATTVPGYWGSNYLHDGNTGKGTKTATFRPTVAAAGQYDVYMWYTAGANRANNVPVDIVHGGGTNTVTVNQTLNGSRWVKLGTFSFAADSAGYVRIRTTGTTGYVMADAVKWVAVAAPVVPPSSVSLAGAPVPRVAVWTSGNWADEYAGDNLVDGDTNSLWVGDAGGAPWSVALDLGRRLGLSDVEVLFFGDAWPNAAVLGSEDSVEWFEFGELTNEVISCRYLYLSLPGSASATNPPAVREVRWEVPASENP